jgi:hypothetical protein
MDQAKKVSKSLPSVDSGAISLTGASGGAGEVDFLNLKGNKGMGSFKL